MSLFGKHDKRSEYDFEEIITTDELGNEVHTFRNSDGEEVHIKKFSMEYRLPTGDEWCPNCHIKMIHKDGYFECPECLHSITDEESEYGEGFPTKESTYEFDF